MNGRRKKKKLKQPEIAAKKNSVQKKTPWETRGDITGCVYLHVCMHRVASQNPESTDIPEVVLALGI